MKRGIFLLLLVLLILSGCSQTKANEIDTQSTYYEEEDVEMPYTSKVEKEECALCSQAGKTLLLAYAGQTNIGIICINTFDMSPVTINRYNDYGKPIKEKAGGTSMTRNSFGEGGMVTTVTANPDRGYADAHVGFTKDDSVDKDKVESLLCQECLNVIMEDTWEEPYGVGVINFETLEVRLFEKNITAFTFGDYYIDVDRRENKDNSEWTELDLLIFYCPLRYE